MAHNNNRVLLRKNSGFTLLELVVVLMIIGIMTALISLNIAAQPSLAKQAAQQLQNLLALAQEEAILKGQILGWKLTSETFAFYRYQQKHWLPLNEDKVLRRYPLQPTLDYQLTLDTSEIVYDKESLPQVIVLPDGSITDFKLIIQLKEDRNEVYAVFSQQNTLKMRRVEKSDSL